MVKIRHIISFILLIGLVFAGIYFREEIARYYDLASFELDKAIHKFEKTEFSTVVNLAEQEIVTPPPLSVGGKDKQIALSRSEIIQETNLRRQQMGLPALVENSKLNVAAGIKANDMFNKQYFEHISPEGVDPSSLVKGAGYDFIVAGENLILGNFNSEEDVVDNWMASPAHKENILEKRYSDIGVAIVKGTYKGETVWIGVQEFGLPLSACPGPSQGLKDEIESGKTNLDLLSLQIDQKKQLLDATDPYSEAYSQMVNDYNALVQQYNVLSDQIKAKIFEYNAQINNFNNCVSGQ